MIASLLNKSKPLNFPEDQAIDHQLIDEESEQDYINRGPHKYVESNRLAAKFQSQQNDKSKSTSSSLNNALSKYDDKELLRQSVQEVEKRFKSRELQEIEIYSLSLTHLTLVHKFNKNCTWCKCSWGDNDTWIAEYQPNTNTNNNDTTTAEWIDLQWRFILPRNEIDRKDLIVTVCSQDVIIGRYALLAKDFSNIPESQSGYFEVNGEIRNVIGFAGRISLICKHVAAARPSRPNPNNHAYDRIYLKITSIALLDLKSAYSNSLSLLFNELNSPYVTVRKDQWERSTSVLVSSGSSGKWSKLNWKIVLERSDTMLFTVMSVSTVIGTVGISWEDIMKHVKGLDGEGTGGLMMYITDGAAISGKIKIAYTVTLFDPYAYRSNSTCNAYGTHDYFDCKAELMKEAGMSSFGIDGEGVPRGTEGTEVGPPLLQTCVPLPLHVPTVHRVLKKVTSIPFTMSITSLAVVDLHPVHILALNSPRVNAVSSTWGNVTSTVRDAGTSAHWSHLRWTFPILDPSSTVRFVVWSKDVLIGSTQIKPLELLEYPVDAEGNAELYLRLCNAYGKVGGGASTCGKLKVSCCFDYYKELHVPVPAYSDVLHVPSNGTHVIGNGTHVLSSGTHVLSNSTHVPSNSTHVPSTTSTCTSLQLPVLAHIETISVLDLKSIHNFLIPNSPRVKLVCDRKSAVTKALRNSGSCGRWAGLDWPVPVLEGSFLMLSVTSGDCLIGKVELPASSLVEIPPNKFSVVEISKYIVDDKGRLTGKIHIVLRLAPLHPPPDPSPGREPHPRVQAPPLLFDRDSLHPAQLRSQGLALEMSIIEIDAFEMKSVHTFSRNSPFVGIACGKFSETTKELPSAGDTAYWTDLKCIFRLKDDSNIRIFLGSKDKVIGTCVIMPQAIFSNSAAADSRGVCKILQPIYDGTRVTGQVKITYLTNIVKEKDKENSRPKSAGIDIHTANGINASNSTVQRPHSASVTVRTSNIAQAEDNELGIINDDIDDDLVFPMIAAINSITVLDLGPAPSASLSPSPSFGKSLVASLFGIDTVNTNPNIKYRLAIQSSNWSAVTPAISLSSADRILSWDNVSYRIPLETINSELKLTLGISERQTLGALKITSEDLLNIPRDSAGYIEVVKSISNPGSSATGKVIMSLKLEAPSHIEQEQIKANSISLANAQTEDALSLTLTQQPPSSARTYTPTPSSKVQLPPPIQHFQPLPNTQPLPARGNNSTKAPSDPLSSSSYITNATTAAKGLDDGQLLNANYSVLTTSQLLPSNSVVSNAQQSSAPDASLPKKIFLTGYKVFLKKIAVINVQTAHRLKTNSLMSTVLCGESLSTTKIIPNSGSAVKWDKLNMTFIIHHSISLRIVVSSRSKNIGSKSWSLEQLLNDSQSVESPRGTINLNADGGDGRTSDLITVFGNLRDDENEITGNIKITFKLQNII